MNIKTDTWFATCPKGLETLLADELLALGATASRETVAGVHFQGPPSVAWRVCLWTRLANRVLWPLASVPAADGDVLYKALRDIEWGELFDARRSIAVDFSGTNAMLRNTQFGAQRCKDAVVDRFQATAGMRPSVDRRGADVRINVRLDRDRARVSIDLAGGSLHQRGYRQRGGAAPLKENLAAAILLRADWPGMAARGGALIDPLCGSATLLVEGAMMAADIAPGLARERFGFERLHLHDDAQWRAILTDARGRAERGRAARLPEIRGYDFDPGVIREARENIERAGLQAAVRVSCRALADFAKPTHRPLDVGLIVTNPPYGERLGEKKHLGSLYRLLGERLAAHFGGWRAAVFTADLELGRAIGLRSHKRYTLYNGTLETYLLLFDLRDNVLRDNVLRDDGARDMVARGKVSRDRVSRNKVAQDKVAQDKVAQDKDSQDKDSQDKVARDKVARDDVAQAKTSAAEPEALSEGARMFANRLTKNRRRLRSWLRRENIECYRLYDADMPEYAVAVDVYGEHVQVAEYKAPRSVSGDAAKRRLEDIRMAVPVALDVPAERVAYKERSRQRGASQYTRQGSRGEFLTVREGGARLLVNLQDYIDTGLFLDHRPLRRRIARESRDRDFLNLFCYTGSATVHAALGGARSTTSVDTSNTYLQWLGRNFEANGFGGAAHRVVKADVAEWLSRTRDRFDLVLLDPPSFSNSKSRADSFDVQRDHPALVRAAMACVRPGGRLYFSTNRRGFRLDTEIAAAFEVEDISAATLDPDFARNPRIHQCWLMRHRQTSQA